MEDKEYVIYVQTQDINQYGFIYNTDYYSCIEYTKRFTDAMCFTEQQIKSQDFDNLEKLLKKIPFCNYHIFKY